MSRSWRTAAGALALIASAVGIALVGGRARWQAATRGLTGRLATSPPAALPGDDEPLPAPVARYLRLALGDAPPTAAGARLRWEGQFLLSPPDGWRPFRATQTVQVRPPGFVWDARIRMAPGLDVFVRDGFVGGEGVMVGAVLGLVPVVDAGETPEIAEGALQRLLGEAVWVPWALLPEHGVRWTAVDASTARASLTVGRTTADLTFHFGPDGWIERISTPARYRDVDGTMVPTPWEAALAAPVERGGVRVPAAGEAAWLLPEGRQPYWRGRIVTVEPAAPAPAP